MAQIVEIFLHGLKQIHTGLTFPVGTRRNNNVIMTSKRRRDVFLTSYWRHYCVVCPLGCRLATNESRPPTVTASTNFLDPEYSSFSTKQKDSILIYLLSVCKQVRFHTGNQAQGNMTMKSIKMTKKWTRTPNSLYLCRDLCIINYMYQTCKHRGQTDEVWQLNLWPVIN